MINLIKSLSTHVKLLKGGLWIPKAVRTNIRKPGSIYTGGGGNSIQGTEAATTEVTLAIGIISRTN